MKKYVKIAFVTGASSGIGRATAKEFAKLGYNLIITGRRKARLQEIKEKLSYKYGVDVKVLAFDIGNSTAAEKAFNSLPKEWRNKIHILVNNAGGAKGLDPFHEGKLEHWETMIDANVKGLLYISRLISPHMVKRTTGHIINVCSTAGHEVYPKGHVYCATKHAVKALTHGMRQDLHMYGIRVSEVSPGHVEETEFALNRFDGDKDKAKIYEDFTPLTSKDVAKTITYIAQQPKHVNIQEVIITGTQQATSMIIDRSGRKYSGVKKTSSKHKPDSKLS